ncbi:hypothetical protein JZO70_00790 [Enterococcus sp. 669A]|uniref:Integral membrane protein n=1 Tax=Candidatus Enterococcus moelleringii TaxID=2815325 RepID=A0ABS3L4Y4_9ENTE|nr:hypothetical protein [Enterococcus sp. 669A]MBO1304679.1 hypothetical protein [Enterococcus sp. 669A]
MYKKLNQYLGRRPGFYLLFLWTILVVVQMIVNGRNQLPLWHNMYTKFVFALCFLLVFFFYTLKLQKRTQFVVGFVSSFIYQIVSNWFNKGLVDYTSLIILAVVAIMCAAFLMIIVTGLERNYERSK